VAAHPHDHGAAYQSAEAVRAVVVSSVLGARQPRAIRSPSPRGRRGQRRLGAGRTWRPLVRP